MQSDLLISIAANFLSGVCTEGTFIYIFYQLFGKKRSWNWILITTIIIDLILYLSRSCYSYSLFSWD